MLSIDIKTNFPDVIKALDTMRNEIASRAASSAVNKTMAQSKTAMSREITQEFNIKASKVKDSLRITRANFKNGTYSITASLESPSQRGRSLNVINFDSKQTRKGVTVKIKKSGSRVLVKGAFIANGGRTVFERVGKRRLPIRAVQTIGIPQMFNTQRINRRVIDFIEQKFPEIFASESRYYTDRFNRGGY